MSLNGKSLCVLTPMYGGNLSLNYYTSMNRLWVECNSRGIHIETSNVYNESLISRARNRLADYYLKDMTATHAVFIDADIGFEPTDLFTMLETDFDIMGVPCSKKSIRWDRVQHAVARRAFEWGVATGAFQKSVNPYELLELYKRSGQEIAPVEFPEIAGDFVMNFPPTFDGQNFEVGKPQDMKHMGTGLLMIKRGVFEKFQKAYPDRWYESKSDAASNPGKIHDFFKCGINRETREYDSEDYWFCHDCIAIGYKVMMMPWVRTSHMGTFTFAGNVPAALAYTGEMF